MLEEELIEAQEHIQHNLEDILAATKEVSLQEAVRIKKFQPSPPNAKRSWLKDGDRCTRFFHAPIKARQLIKNTIW